MCFKILLNILVELQASRKAPNEHCSIVPSFNLNGKSTYNHTVTNNWGADHNVKEIFINEELRAWDDREKRASYKWDLVAV